MYQLKSNNNMDYIYEYPFRFVYKSKYLDMFYFLTLCVF